MRLAPPRRSKRYIACSDFSHTKIRTRSDRCSSFPNRTHFVGLRFVLETLFAGGTYHISMLHGSRLAIVAGLLFLFLNWKCSGLLISLIFAFRCQSGLQCGLSLLLQNAAEIPVSCFCLLLTTKSAPLSGADGMVHMDVQRQLRQRRAGPLHRTIVPPAMLMEGHSTV